MSGFDLVPDFTYGANADHGVTEWGTQRILPSEYVTVLTIQEQDTQR